MKRWLIVILVLFTAFGSNAQCDTTLVDRNLTLVSDQLSVDELTEFIDRWMIAYSATADLDTILVEFDELYAQMSPEAQADCDIRGEELKEAFHDCLVMSFGFVYMCDNFTIEIMMLDESVSEYGCAFYKGKIVYTCYDQTRRAELTTIKPSPESPMTIFLVKDEDM